MNAKLIGILATIIVTQFFIIIVLLFRQRLLKSPVPTEKTVLVNPIGITIAKAGKEDFYEIAPAGQRLPFLYSNTFTTAFVGQKQVEVTICQKLSYGLEKLVTIIMAVPSEPSGTHQVIVTMKIDNNKNMTLKATAIKSGQVRAYGPYPVD